MMPAAAMSAEGPNLALADRQGTFTRKLRNVEDACDEIADRWPRIKPPADYDGRDPE
jgi:hypothetical protein